SPTCRTSLFGSLRFGGRRNQWDCSGSFTIGPGGALNRRRQFSLVTTEVDLVLLRIETNPNALQKTTVADEVTTDWPMVVRHENSRVDHQVIALIRQEVDRCLDQLAGGSAESVVHRPGLAVCVAESYLMSELGIQDGELGASVQQRQKWFGEPFDL